ncbi:unnamed protein product [Brassica rapa subsp. trilocularis]
MATNFALHMGFVRRAWKTSCASRNSVISIGRSVFGIRHMFVWFNLGSKESLLKKSFTITIISFAVTSQKR